MYKAERKALLFLYQNTSNINGHLPTPTRGRIHMLLRTKVKYLVKGAEIHELRKTPWPT